MSELVSVKQAAKMLRVTRGRIYALAHEGRLTRQDRKDRRVYITKHSLDNYQRTKGERGLQGNGWRLYELTAGNFPIDVRRKLAQIITDCGMLNPPADL